MDEKLERCLREWRESADRRRAMALELLAGRLSADDFETRWEWYDVLAEANHIKQERAEDRRRADQARREYEAKERQKQEMHQQSLL